MVPAAGAAGSCALTAFARLSISVSSCRARPTPATSCATRPVGPGLDSEDFLVEAGASRDGGELCPLPAACDVIGAGTLEVSGRNALWQLTNVGLESSTIQSIHLVGPEANGDLKKVKLDSKKIAGVQLPPPEALIDSGWSGQTKDREIEKDKTRTLKLEFEEDALAGNAVCDCCGGDDGDSDSDSGSDSGSDSDSGDSDSGGDSDSSRDSDSGQARNGDQHAALGSWHAKTETPGPWLAATWLDTRFPWLSAFFGRLGAATHPAL